MLQTGSVTARPETRHQVGTRRSRPPDSSVCQVLCAVQCVAKNTSLRQLTRGSRQSQTNPPAEKTAPERFWNKPPLGLLP